MPLNLGGLGKNEDRFVNKVHNNATKLLLSTVDQTFSQASLKNYTKPYSERQRVRISISARKEAFSDLTEFTESDSDSFSSFLFVSAC